MKYLDEECLLIKCLYIKEKPYEGFNYSRVPSLNKGISDKYLRATI